MLDYQYFICDVFTTEKFGGNQLSVLTDSRGLSDEQMQNIAREFNFSETAFVFPPEEGQHRKIRIYTPTSEVPFAGHPTIGAAFVLAESGDFGTINEPMKVAFEEEAGIVEVDIRYDHNGILCCELEAPSQLAIGDFIPTHMVASSLSLREADIVTKTHSPQIASVGLPFIFVEVPSLPVLQQAEINMSKFHELLNRGFESYIHVYCQNTGDFDIRARMFAPTDGVPEDPATGSANCALIGLLAYYDNRDTFKKSWRISQGIEMGRPSILQGRTQKENGQVLNTWIGGNSVLISEGILKL